MFAHFWLLFRPWGAPGPLLEATLFLDSFLARFWLPFGLQFGSLLASFSVSFFVSFLRTLRERPRTALGRILGSCWLRFGSFLGSFLEHLQKVKIELSPWRGPHFHCPRGPGNLHFFDILSERPPEHPLGGIFGLPGSILARFWGPLGTQISIISRPFFKVDF